MTRTATETSTTHTAKPAEQPTAPTTPQPAASPTIRQKRRPALIALAIALIVAGSLGAYFLVSSTAGTEPVVTAADTIQAGQVIERDDLSTADLSNPDGTISTIPGDQLESLVGQRAAVTLTTGMTVPADAVAPELVPGEGESLVGVALTAAQMPAEEIVPGDQVQIVLTPRAQDDAPTTEPTLYQGTVAGVAASPDTGQTIVDLTVPESEASWVASSAATGRVSLVLLSREEA